MFGEQRYETRAWRYPRITKLQKKKNIYIQINFTNSSIYFAGDKLQED